jgi:IS4 transposase
MTLFGQHHLPCLLESRLSKRYQTIVMSLVTDEKGNELARWYLLSNVFDVDATEIAMWYCHRWNIESWFKLLKTNGHQLEKWQQTTGELILKRLIVASVATTLVFKLYSDKSE